MAKTVCEEKNNQLCDYLQKICKKLTERQSLMYMVNLFMSETIIFWPNINWSNVILLLPYKFKTILTHNLERLLLHVNVETPFIYTA